MRRGVALALAAVGLVLLSGCLSPLPSEDEVDYGDRWNTSADVTYYIDDSTFTAVVSVASYNGTEFEIWERDPFGGDNPVQVSGVRFRRGSGNVTNLTEVDTSGDRTVVTLPETEGQVAYVAAKSGTEFTHPAPVNGTVEVRLPPGTDARNFFLGKVSPGDYEAASEEPLVLRWDGLDRGTYVTVEYYRRGYPWIFVAVLTVLTAMALVVVYYYRRRLQDMRERKLGP